MKNRLQDQTSPYLLQHAENPVDWYPWCEEAFRRATQEKKPVFLSIGYSTCHWCHVMARESFEDPEIAELLNRYFISIKVDKEERPDIDHIYMAACQAFTGRGGWPISIFMTPEQKPFFAGNYFPKTQQGGMPGMKELLLLIADQWAVNREVLLQSAEEILVQLQHATPAEKTAGEWLLDSAIGLYTQVYDRNFGGFGAAPKFPSPHNLIFLLRYGSRYGNFACWEMAENTLLQMYRGGLFDHIGGGFCRYATDRRFLIPHFEKMLYDNALLISAYCQAYTVTNKALYLEIAEKIASYILREMTSPEGGFYSAQDADSDGKEGKYYLFSPEELTKLLGSQNGDALNRRFGIRFGGNFNGKSIPNLRNSDPEDRSLDHLLPKVYEYRKRRSSLHLDDKILTSWNALMIAAMCHLYQVSKNERYLHAAKQAEQFLHDQLWEGNTLFVSYRIGKRGEKGFLDDYAGFLYALLILYETTLTQTYLERAEILCKKILAEFKDKKQGGFFLSNSENESLILRPKESYDGAVPSGNSLMAWNLVRLSHLTDEAIYEKEARCQLNWLAVQAEHYPIGYAMYLIALLDDLMPPRKIVVVLKRPEDRKFFRASQDTIFNVLSQPTSEYPLKNEETTFYVCQDGVCYPPVNHLDEITFSL